MTQFAEPTWVSIVHSSTSGTIRNNIENMSGTEVKQVRQARVSVVSAVFQSQNDQRCLTLRH